MRHLVVLLLLLPCASWAETLTGTACDASSSAGCAIRSVSGYPSVAVSLSGTWTGAVIFEVAPASTGPFHATRAYRPDGSGTYVTTATQNGAWTAVTGGFPHFRVRAASLNSGSIVVTAHASNYTIPSDIVRAVGSDFGQVQTSGTSILDAASVAALAAPVCSVVTAPPVVALTTTPVTVDPSPLSNRTQIVIRNLSGTQNVWCCAGVDCTPTVAGAYVLLPNGDHYAFPVRATHPIRCRSAAASAPVNVLEASCG